MGNPGQQCENMPANEFLRDKTRCRTFLQFDKIFHEPLAACGEREWDEIGEVVPGK